MTDRVDTYDLKEVYGETSVQYFFVSNGDSDVVKVVAYDYVQDLCNSPLFNLGFGDYDIENDRIDDSVNTNNGDHYNVFYTVLSTVPHFFERYPNATMVVEGSDHGEEFANKCRENCRKKCLEKCKNLNRRIKAYRNFVEKNFSELTQYYSFFGGTRTENGIILHDNYEIGTEYDLVFCEKICSFTI